MPLKSRHWWVCDQCDRETDDSMPLVVERRHANVPTGERMGINQPSFCSYGCLAEWAQERSQILGKEAA